jgi:hypothetical protein
VFTVEDRERVRDRVLQLAATDDRVVAECLLHEAGDARDLAAKAQPELRKLTATWSD